MPTFFSALIDPIYLSVLLQSVLWTTFGVIVGTWCFGVLFAAYSSFWQAKQRGEKLDWFHWYILGPGLTLGYPLDLIWDSTVGSILFRETPWSGADCKWWEFWKFTFTGHCKKWKDAIGRRGDVARVWQVRINTICPGHI